MSKKYVILEHIVDDFSDKLETRIYENCLFDDKEDAERIAEELDVEYKNPNDYNEVKELSQYHDTDENFIELED